MKLVVNKDIIEIDNGKQKKHTIQVINPDLIEQKKLTQQEVILLHLLNIGAVTNKTCREGYGYGHCPSIIRNLKEDYGVEFTTIKQKGLNIKNRYKQQTEYVEYHISNPSVYREALKCQ